MYSPAGCKGLRKYKKQIERDEGIAEELQDGNKSNRADTDFPRCLIAGKGQSAARWIAG